MLITGGVRSARDRLRVTIHLVDGASGYYLWSESADRRIAAIRSAARRRSPSALPTNWRRSLRAAQCAGAAAAIRQSRGAQPVPAGPLPPESAHGRRPPQGRRLLREGDSSKTPSSRWRTAGSPTPTGCWRTTACWARPTCGRRRRRTPHRPSCSTATQPRRTRRWRTCAPPRTGIGPAPRAPFLRAIQLNPRYPTGRHWYAMSCLVPMARLDEALEEILLAQALDPVSSIIARDVAVMHYYRRDFEAALEQCDHTIELNPHFAPAYQTLGLIQEQRRDFDESAAAFRRAIDLAPHSLRMHERARAHARPVRPARARARDLAQARRNRSPALRLAVRVRRDALRPRRYRERLPVAGEGLRRSLFRVSRPEGRSPVRSAQGRPAICRGLAAGHGGVARPPSC